MSVHSAFILRIAQFLLSKNSLNALSSCQISVTLAEHTVSFTVAPN